jgi:hypothetical protein
MSERFVKATVESLPDSYRLNFSCVNGADASGHSITISNTNLYVTGAELQEGDTLMFNLAKDDTLKGGLYPFGDPVGNPPSCQGGKGKGTVGDTEQRAAPIQTKQLGASAAMANPIPSVSSTPLSVRWINGIWMNNSIDLILDPAYLELPFGAEVYFDCSYDSDGNLQVNYVALSEGDAGDPS